MAMENNCAADKEETENAFFYMSQDALFDTRFLKKEWATTAKIYTI